MNIKRYTIPLTTSSGGAATGYSEEPVTGRVLQVAYVPGAQAIDTNGDLDITLETTGVVVANHDNIGTTAFTRCYRQPTHEEDGSEQEFASGLSVHEPVYVSGERIKAVIANGGDTKSGTLFVWVG